MVTDTAKDYFAEHPMIEKNHGLERSFRYEDSRARESYSMAKKVVVQIENHGIANRDPIYMIRFSKESKLR